jgi:TolA-binding protein
MKIMKRQKLSSFVLTVLAATAALMCGIVDSQAAETARKDNEQLTKDQADIQRSAAQTQNAQALRTQLQQLQGKKNDLLKRIGQIEMLPEYLSQRSRTGRGGWYNYPNPARADLPSLKDHLNDVNLDIEQTRRQLQQNEQAQH